MYGYTIAIPPVVAIYDCLYISVRASMYTKLLLTPNIQLAMHVYLQNNNIYVAIYGYSYTLLILVNVASYRLCYTVA